MTSASVDLTVKEQTIRRLAREVFSQGLTGLIPELVTQDIEYESPTSSVRGIEQFAYLISILRSVWADLDVEISRVRSEGESVIAEMSFSGRHVKDFMGVAARGKEFMVSGSLTISFRASLICRIDVTYLLNNWLNQVGKSRG